MQIIILAPGFQALAANLGKTQEEIQALGRGLITEATTTVTAAVIANTPVKTGNLKSSIYGTVSGFTGTVFVDQSKAPYAKYVEDGTQPHSIYPKSKQALYWSGAAHPVASVNHPGNKPNPFFEKGVAEALPIIESLGKIMLEKLAKGLI